jgi:zinc D-Ala-D-Ala dipeptidase
MLILVFKLTNITRKSMMKIVSTIFLFLCLNAPNILASELRGGFVYLSDVDPSILINLKYHHYENFIGKPLTGCTGGRAVVSYEAAKALRNIQEDLVMHGYSLVVYDAYRPEKSYTQFKDWLTKQDDVEIKNLYYPNLLKSDIESNGYIKEKYAHVRGSTVDVTLISLKDQLLSPCMKQKRSYKRESNIIYMGDGSLDMGTSYDMFDPLSSHGNKHIPEDAQVNRNMLREVMQNYGFIPSSKFWWQFTLVREPYIDSKFDFDV